MFETVTSEFANEVDKNYSIRFGLAVINVHNVRLDNKALLVLCLSKLLLPQDMKFSYVFYRAIMTS
jgi:hypothetical protein